MQDVSIDKIYQMLTSTDKELARMAVELFKESFSNPFDFMDLRLKVLHHKWRSEEEQEIGTDYLQKIHDWAMGIGKEDCEKIKQRSDVEQQEADREANSKYL